MSSAQPHRWGCERHLVRAKLSTSAPPQVLTPDSAAAAEPRRLQTPHPSPFPRHAAGHSTPHMLSHPLLPSVQGCLPSGTKPKPFSRRLKAPSSASSRPPAPNSSHLARCRCRRLQMPGGSDPLFWGPVGVRTPPRHPPRLPEGPGLYPTTAQGGPGQVRRRAPATVRGQGQGWPSPPAQPPHGGRQVRPDLSVCEAASRVRPALQGLRGQEGPGRDQGGRSAQRAWAPLGGGGQHWMPQHRCHLARS